MQESRYGHISRREEEYVGKGVMVMEVPGKIKRGRQKRRWLGNIMSDGDGGAGEDKEGEDRIGGGWVTS